MGFLVDLRTKSVENDHNKAIGIFAKAIKKFEDAIGRANVNMNKNIEEINTHEAEMNKRREANLLIQSRVETMKKSIAKINHIIGE